MGQERTAFCFQVSPTSGLPLYRQLIDQVGAQLASGRLLPGQFLPSVRQVAAELQINPMTVSKAYALLEHDGVLELVRGQGMRIKAPGTPGTLRERKAALQPFLEQAAAKAYQLALTREQVEDLFHPLLERLKP